MLQSPLKPKSYGVDKGIIQLTQLFGEMDMDYKLLSLKGHNGIDLRTKHFENGLAPVVAAHDGTVISEKSIQSDTGGRFVRIRSNELELAKKKCVIETIYFHLSSCRHAIYTEVRKGQLIGTAGNTGGFSTGPHLHFGLYIYWKQKDGSYKADLDNGYGGAVDPMPYFTDNNVMQCGDSMFGRKFFYNGKKIQREQVNALIPKQYR